MRWPTACKMAYLPRGRRLPRSRLPAPGSAAHAAQLHALQARLPAFHAFHSLAPTSCKSRSRHPLHLPSSHTPPPCNRLPGSACFLRWWLWRQCTWAEEEQSLIRHTGRTSAATLLAVRQKGTKPRSQSWGRADACKRLHISVTLLATSRGVEQCCFPGRLSLSVQEASFWAKQNKVST